jgi:hypothetical protein
MNTRDICTAIGVLSELSDKLFDASLEKQSDAWFKVRGVIHILTGEIENIAKREVCDE